MTQEERTLLLKVLCTMLPYGVVVGYEHYTDRHIVTTKLTGIRGGLYYDADGQIPDNELKPYLRPLSSMTEKEKKAFDEFICIDEDAWLGKENGCVNQAKIMSGGIDWLNKNMFDYRGLIPMGLALPAPEGMY